jgi:hypothetical protein
MILALLWVDAVNKPSLISKSATETQVNIHHAGKKLITWHAYDLEDPPYGNRSQWQSESQSGSHLHLVHAFHMIAPWLSVGGPYTIPVYITIRMVGYRPTLRSSTLLSLLNPVNLACVSTVQCLLFRAQMTWSITNTGRGYHLGASNILWSSPRPSHPMILHFPLVAPPGLKLTNFPFSSNGSRLWTNRVTKSPNIVSGTYYPTSAVSL